MGAMRYAIVWDKAQGRVLYDQGLSYDVMSRRLGVSRASIHRYAATYWPARMTTGAPHRPAGQAPAMPKAKPLRPGESTLPALPSLEAP
jgi:transposase